MQIGVQHLLAFLRLLCIATGTEAAEERSLCSSNVCFNGGTCLVERDPVQDTTTFKCECPPDFGGTLCEESVKCERPCQNGGNCTLRDGRSGCECARGFAGSDCSVAVDCQESGCASGQTCLLDLASSTFSCQQDQCQPTNPCANNATCRPVQDGFICECPKGFIGRTCEEDVDECEASLATCLHGGTCVNTVGGFRCDCSPGFQGKICEQRVGFCVQKPCVHGECEDLVVGYKCNCNPGFAGTHCEENANCEVEGRECGNGGICVRNGTKTLCKCTDAFRGKWCENAVEPTSNDPCAADFKCHNGGSCVQKDGIAKCECAEGFSGTHCLEGEQTAKLDMDQQNVAVEADRHIKSCEECANARKCLVSRQRQICLCPPTYAGPTCSEPSDPCQQHHCPNGRVCRLRRTRNGDSPSCQCPEGLVGPACEHPVQAASFNKSSLVVLQTHGDLPNGLQHILRFSYRTTVPDIHIVTGETILNEIVYRIGLRKGVMYLQLGSSKDVINDIRTNDADWYGVVFGVTESNVSIEVTEENTGYVIGHKVVNYTAAEVFNVKIGRVQGEHFLGCIKGISVDEKDADIFARQRSVEIGRGCSRVEQCRPETCAHGGHCVDLWWEHRCECRRPFLEPNCAHKLSESTFGHDNESSLAEYVIDSNSAALVSQTTEVSMIVRTNRASGSILRLGQRSDDDTGTFLSLSLNAEGPQVETRLGGRKVHSLQGRMNVTDNQPHVITVEREGNHVTLFVDGRFDGDTDLGRPFEHPLLVDRLTLGGNESDSAFKGTLQDVRVNNLPLLLTPGQPSFLQQPLFGTLIESRNVLEGTVSDQLCRKLSPCVHGQCADTFNDYQCTCERGFMGRNCELTDYCAASPCHTASQCSNTHGGFICVAPATFASTSIARFVLEQNNDDSTVNEFVFQFSVRTRSEDARIFTMAIGNETFWMQLEKNAIALEINNNSSESVDRIEAQVANGQWHELKFMVEDQKLFLSLDNSTARSILGNWTWSPNWGHELKWVSFGKEKEQSGFKGCLHNVVVGAMPQLSFFAGPEAGDHLVGVHLRSQLLQGLRPDGCHSKNLCGPANPCKNGALCRDLFNLRHCECAPGFEGDFCEKNQNDCTGGDLCGENGKCVDEVDGYRCECNYGFHGAKCAENVQFCSAGPCRNNAVCVEADPGYQCKCPEEFLGVNCTVSRTVSCQSKPCLHDGKCADTEMGPQCTCMEGFSGQLCEVTPGDLACQKSPCENGGRCAVQSNGTYTCHCQSGFEGEHCELVADQCRDSPCAHGQCRSVVGGFVCECEPGWEGATCEQDLDECLEEFPCENNGSCINSAGAFACTCAPFYLGDRCQIAGICTEKPCQHGTCEQKSVSKYECVCDRGYEGQNCDAEIDYCKTDPCMNGGSCLRQVGGFQCRCIAGFTGERCEVDVDDCAGPEKCANGGKCVDRVNGFECNCQGTGYKGVQCQEDVDECTEPGVNCVNGVCENMPGSFHCTCTQGYIGDRCSMVDPCLPDGKNRTLHSCVHGDCINPRVVRQPSGREFVEHDCKCFQGYGGPQCIHILEKSNSVSLAYILGPSVVLLLVCAILCCMLFFFVARNRRANQGTYSPSNQEVTGARVQNPVKKQERLI